jgi:STE24 endopeptidase
MPLRLVRALWQSYTGGMEVHPLTLVFAVALVASVGLRLWLVSRQMRHVARHAHTVPGDFSASVTPQAHLNAARYTLAKGRLGVISMLLGAAILVGWTLLGGLDALNAMVHGAIRPLWPGAWGDLAYQLALVGAFVLVSTLVDLPLEAYATFGVEQRFGFNRMTWRLFATDLLRSLGVGVVIGVPLAASMLWLMGMAGSLWWAWAWGAWMGFSVLMLVLYPTVIAAWFNRFEPLADESLRGRVEALLQRCGFASRGLFVMDGSRRSSHGNAYFTGFGAAKRVVFFDTLLARLTPSEIEAVLAHELGHFRRRHLTQRLLLSAVASFAAFALLGWLADRSWFYTALGVSPRLDAPNDALALLLFLLVVPVFWFFVTPLMARVSRQHEFEADAYACEQASGRDLAAALVKLHRDNASTLTPDPWYARFYYSHPPAAERLRAIAANPANAAT